MVEALSYPFVQNAIVASVLLGAALGIVGTLVVVNRMVFLSGGVAHSAYGGIGLAFFFGFSPLLGAAAFSVAIAVLMAYMTIKGRERSDTIIGVIWAVGMAFGVILTDLSPGYNADLMSYLFGSLIAIEPVDLLIFASLDLVIAALVALLYPQILAFSFDEQFARIKGVKTDRLFVMMLIFASLTIVMAIRLVGLMLVIALLTIPVWIAEKFVKTLWQMMIVSGSLSLLFLLGGLWISFVFDLTSGATVIMVAAAAFFAVYLLCVSLSSAKRSKTISADEMERLIDAKP